MHSTQQVLNSENVSRSAVSHSLQPYGLWPPGSSVHGILQARILEWGAMPWGIIPTQESNPGLLHCRQIPYHLSQQESPATAMHMFIHSLNLPMCENWHRIRMPQT